MTLNCNLLYVGVRDMPSRMRRLLLIFLSAVALFCLFSLGANAYTYPSMPSDWQNVQVTVGTVTMPLARYPSGSIYDPEKRYMTVEEQKDYGFNIGGNLDLRGWECVGFARYVYSALFYKYPQDATIDTSLAYSYAGSYAYRDMIEEVLGTRTLAAGYSASTLKQLITACQPGAVMRISGHSLVIMAIYDDGILVYDANYSSDNEVSVRPYTWQEFVNSVGSRGIEALHMPAYYPGYSYSTGDNNYYELDTSAAGNYVVIDGVTLNVRTMPTTSSSTAGTLSEGDVVEVFGTYNGWGKITYNGKGCWVFMDYLKKQGIEVSVTFDANGGKASATSGTYMSGEAFGALPTAQKTNRSLIGWTDGTTIYTSESIVPSVATLALKAQWCILDYEDVLEEAWFASYVEDAYFKGLISHDTHFDPDDYASRAHMITVLGREYERETGTEITGDGQTAFEDVTSNSYYAVYVAWGSEVGIVKGITETEFWPNENVTREQIAEFLYRLAIYTGVTQRQDGDLSVLDRFSDKNSVSEYARAAMCWAVDVGILQGDDAGKINPQNPARRSEMITMFSRYIDYIETAEKVQIEITFDANGGTVDQSSATYELGGTLGELPTPTKENRTFLGWYYEDTQYTSDTKVPDKSLTLIARWGVLNYTDVEEEHWYVPYLERAYEYGLVDGVGSFDPWSQASRSDMVTFLGRIYEYLSGETIPEATTMVFEDVDLSAPYAKYVAWGYEMGLVQGIDATHFAPDADVTREQVATFLMRLADKTDILDSYTEDLSVLERFDDGDQVHEFYRSAICWAVSAGILSGDDQNNLNAQGLSTRAVLLTMMLRYIDYAAEYPSVQITASQELSEIIPEPEATAVPETELEQEPADETQTEAEPESETESTTVMEETSDESTEVEPEAEQETTE